MRSSRAPGTQRGLAIAGPSDQIGYEVDLDGGTILFGANCDAHAGPGTGAAYGFERDSDGTWSERQKLTASDGAERDEFGASVAILADTLVVRASNDDGDVLNSGSVHVLTRGAPGEVRWTATIKQPKAHEFTLDDVPASSSSADR